VLPERGSVIIVVVTLVTIVSTIIFAASTLIISGNKNASRLTSLKQAHYVAEAGIENTISNPIYLRDALRDGQVNIGQSIVETDIDGKTGRYQVTLTKSSENTIEARSTGYIENPESGNTISHKTIICDLQLKPGSFYDLTLGNAITTEENIDSGKVYIRLDEGVSSDLQPDVYCGGDIITISGNIPGSVIAEGEVQIGNTANISGNVIAKGSITLANGVKVGSNVISWEAVYISNQVEISGDIVAGLNNTGETGTLVNIGNQSHVGDIYTPDGENQVAISTNSTCGSIFTLSDTKYDGYLFPSEGLPQIDEETKNLWIKQAKSDDIIYPEGLTVGNGETYTIDGNAYINGNLLVDNNATLLVKEGSIIYVTGYITIENNAVVETIEADGDPNTKRASSFITENYFDILNNAIPENISLVVLGEATSSFKNNSVNTGAIFVPNGTLEVKNNAIVHGGVFAKKTIIGNNAEIYFNPMKVLSIPPVGTSNEILRLLEWREN